MKPDTDTVGRVRVVSKHLYGSRYRLEVGAYIAQQDPGVFFARQIAQALGIPDNVVHGEIQHFAAAGLLQRLDQVSGQRAQYFQRMDGEYWASCSRVLREIETRPEE